MCVWSAWRTIPSVVQCFEVRLKDLSHCFHCIFCRLVGGTYKLGAQALQVAFSSGSTIHFDISDWSACWSDQLFLHCVATGLNHVVQVPTCAFKGANGRPWLFVSSSEAFATCLGATCSCNGSHDMQCAPFYPPALIEVFSSMICAAALDKCQSQCSFICPRGLVLYSSQEA